MKKSGAFIFHFLVAIMLHGQIPQEGLEAYFPFSGNTNDESENAYDASVSGCTYTSDRIDVAAHALHISQAGQLVLPLQNMTPFTGDFAISIWFRTSNQIRSHLIELGYWIGGDGDGGNFQISLLSGGTVWAYWNGLGENALISQQVIHVCDNKWHHMVISRNLGEISLYIDKALVMMMPWSTHFYDGEMGDDEPILIGNSENPFVGDVDDIAIYSNGLNDSQVEDLFHDQQPLVMLSPAITDRYPQNSTCEFVWKTHSSVQTLELSYSLDAGISWISIASGLNASLNQIVWTMPSLPIGAEIFVRVESEDDQTIMQEVGPFYISEYHWEEVNSNCEWLPRDGAGVLTFQDKMWLLGGWNPSVDDWLPGYTCNEVWNSEDGHTWNFVGDAPWSGRHTAGWLVHDDMLWIIGGDWNSGVQQMDVWNSSDGINWNQVLDTLPMEVRMTHLVASLGDEMIYFGGQTLTFLDFLGGEIYNDVWRSNDGINWTELTDDAGWHPRGQIEGHYVRNDTLWLIGGGTYDARHMYSDVWNTTDGINWNLVTEAANFTPRQYHEVGVFDNRLWVLGGYEGIGNRNDVWYSDNGADWYELKNTPWPPRHAGGVCTYDSSLWMISGNLWNDSWRLNKADMPSIQLEKQQQSTYQIWPNPTHDVLYISGPLNAKHRIYDLDGKLLMEIAQTSAWVQMELGQLPNSVYMLKIEGNGALKIVVAH